MGILMQITQGGTAVADTLNKAALTPVKTEQTISWLELVIKGGWIMIPILLLSIGGLYIFFERFL